MKIVVLDGYTENPGDLSWSGFEGLGEFTVYDRGSETDKEGEAIARIGDAEIVITNKTPITKRVLDSCPSIRYIGVLATGYNVVDYTYAAKQGIPVTNVPGYGTDTVAQFTFALLLEICHHVAHHSEAVHVGRWEQCADFCFCDYPQIELAGKTMGIIGFGRIGQKVGIIAKAFGMRVLAYSPHEYERGKAIGTYVNLETLLAESDIISLHCPLTDRTQNIMNAEAFARMKKTAILINVARGPVVDEQALYDALTTGEIAAAGLDVLNKEPIAADNPLAQIKDSTKLFITPHMAWGSNEARTRCAKEVYLNIKSFLAGEERNVVV